MSPHTIRAGAVVLAAGLSLAVPGAAQAAQDVVKCEIDFRSLSGTAQAGGGTFSAKDATAVCAHESAGGGSHGQGASYGGAPATVSGTWSSAACGTGRVAGRLTIDAFRPVDVDFDVPTTAGSGVARVHAYNADGGHGTGGILLTETLTHEACPQPLDERTPIQAGPVDAWVGGGDHGPGWMMTATVRFEIP